ncbi:DUF3160 domain-containing protein [Clostridium sp. 'deep sea']|uniref:DUF3160 domain-containing protein n=1 Tax=Clostridium sp. 'deep sea' TaxID=2779445 RepID=UPI001896870C|nr:DUF3160 domain-containing protein [Clostridium sp. 'deep sea']QOR36856.1 DUF3160 domain-containing protein [Clostridium sp. 'deep sea']
MFLKKVVSYILCFTILTSVLVLPTGCTNRFNNISSKDNNNPVHKIDNVKEQDLKPQEKVQFASKRKEKNINVPYTASSFETLVKPYKVKEDLSNIENLDQFEGLTDNQKKLICQNGFVVMPSKEEQLFYIYENNEYREIPSFITTDSVLQVYHVFYNYSLRTLEKDTLIGYTEQLTESMMQKSVSLYIKVINKEVKQALLKNISFFATAWLTLEKELPDYIPKEAANLATAEYELILGEGGFLKSKIFPFELDYSQYKPRGHYTRDNDFKRYFRTMMWYGQVPYPLYNIKSNGEKERNVKQTLQALLITYTVFLENKNSNDIDLWEGIFEPTNFYVGACDDLTIYHYKDLLTNVYGDSPDINTLTDENKLNKLYLEAKKLPEPKIRAKYTRVSTPVSKQMRFMGQRYVPDSEIIQQLVKPIQRPVPSGLDVMAALGSSRAHDIQIEVNEEDKKWSKYPIILEELKDKFSKLNQDEWQSNMYYGWMWTLKGLLKKHESGYPSFMTNQAWQDKSLTTALASWSELKHDTILYGKFCGAECGGGYTPITKGYVEPSIEVYDKLLWLTKYSRENLKQRGILSGGLESKLQRFEDLLQFLITCSIKQLKNEQLTEQEYDKIMTYGGTLEYLTSSFAGDGIRWFEITSETDKNMAVIADIHTIAPNEFSDGGYLEVGVGPAHEIFVVVPIDGSLYLTRGAVFSYYEFLSKVRLTDEEWQKTLKEDNQPAQLEWMKQHIDY